jgi:nitroreductase
MDIPHSYRFVDEAIISRRSVRAFKPDPVPRAVVEDILTVAARAPSGTNIQPWKVHVMVGDSKSELTRKILAVFNDADEAAKHTEDYPYYPEKFVSPYIDRRRKIGWDMYGLLGIGKGDTDKMRAQSARNYMFFDAPVGLMFVIDRAMRQGSWLDYGMFIQNVMVAARARGLDTCPQQAFSRFHRVIEQHLQLPDDEMVVCGMALGVADNDAPVNKLTTEREPVSGFARFHGY